MEIVSNLSFSDRIYIPWERMLRVCLIFLLSGMLYLGVQTHMESVEEEPRGDIVSAADTRSEKEILRTEPIGFRKDAGNIAGILPSGDIGESGILPIPFAANDTNAIKTVGKTEASEDLRINIMNPGESEFKTIKPFVGGSRVTDEGFGDSGVKAPEPIIQESEVTAEGFRDGEVKIKVPAQVIEETKITTEDSKTVKDETITPVVGEAGKIIMDSEENKTDTEAPSVPITDESGIKTEDPDNSENQTVVGGEDANGADAGAGRTEEDVSGTDVDADNADVDPDISGTTIVSGFILDEEGYITGTESDVDVTDGILVFPVESGCVGIREGALSGLDEYVYEIYIPANIHDIEPGVFEEFTSFLYIEVAEDNPCYYSMDGSLYSMTGEEIFIPCEE